MINLAKSAKTNAGGSKWTTYKSKRTIKQEKAAQSTWNTISTKRRRISLRGQREAMGPCWSCDSEGHYKDECPFLRCRYCKILGHKVADCPAIQEGQRRRVSAPVTLEPVRVSGRSSSNPVGDEVHCDQNTSRTVAMTGKREGERRLPVQPTASKPAVTKARPTNEEKKQTLDRESAFQNLIRHVKIKQNSRGLLAFSILDMATQLGRT